MVDGSTRKFNISQALKIFEDYEINKIKNNNCKVVLDKCRCWVFFKSFYFFRMGDLMVDFLKMSKEEKVFFLDEIFERQRQINELNRDGFIKLFFLYKLEQVYRNQKDKILKQLSGQKSYSEIMDIIVSFFK